MIAGDHSFDRDDPRRKRFEEEKSPKSRDQERARAVATPTDFAVDFGRGHKSSPSFDASNGEYFSSTILSTVVHVFFC